MVGHFVYCNDLILFTDGPVVRIVSDSGAPKAPFTQHESEVTCLVRDRRNTDCVFSADDGGNLMCWNVATHETTARFRVNGRVSYLSVLSHNGNNLLAACVETGGCKSLTLHDLEKQSAEELCTSFEMCDIVSDCVAIVLGEKKVYISHPFDESMPAKSVELEDKVACVACCPVARRVAVAVDRGVIHIIPYGEGEHYSVHWHAHVASSLVWSEDGSVLYSGGQEGVLVMWTLDDYRSQGRFTVPRLGSRICTIAPSPNRPRVAVACAASSVVIVDTAQRRMINRIQIATTGSAAAGDDPSVEPIPFLKDCVLLLGMPNCLRIFDVEKNKILKHLTILPQNAISSVESEALPKFSVTRACFTADGKWLATAEHADVRLHGDFINTIRFWRIVDAAAHNWEPRHTHISPHTDEITVLLSHPSLPFVVSGSLDSTLKGWASIGDQEKVVWKPGSRVSRKPLKPQCACFSADRLSSVLFVGSSYRIILFSVPSFEFIGELVNEVDGDAFVKIIGSSATTLAAATEKKVFVWDVLSRTLLWVGAVAPRVALLLPLPASDVPRFGIFNGVDVLECAVGSPGVVHTWPKLGTGDAGERACVLWSQKVSREYACLQGKLVSIARGGRVRAASFELREHELKQGGPDSSLWGTVLIVNPEDAAEGAPGNKRRKVSDAIISEPINAAPAKANDVFAAGGDKARVELKAQQRPLNFLFTNDSHSIPSVRILFDKFMENLLVRRPS